MQPQWEAAHKTSEVLKKDFKRLEEKVDEACRRRDALIARQLAAEAQRHVATIGPSMSKAQKSFSKFDRMERKVEQLEGEALALVELSDANRDLEEEIETSERSAEVEAELDALKERMGKQKTGS
jgi:phage shock protein A